MIWDERCSTLSSKICENKPYPRPRFEWIYAFCTCLVANERNVNTFCTCIALSYLNLHKIFGTTFLEIAKFKRREHNVNRKLSNIYNK